jgi:hypothetical protein
VSFADHFVAIGGARHDGEALFDYYHLNLKKPDHLTLLVIVDDIQDTAIKGNLLQRPPPNETTVDMLHLGLDSVQFGIFFLEVEIVLDPDEEIIDFTSGFLPLNGLLAPYGLTAGEHKLANLDIHPTDDPNVVICLLTTKDAHHFEFTLGLRNGYKMKMLQVYQRYGEFETGKELRALPHYFMVYGYNKVSEDAQIGGFYVYSRNSTVQPYGGVQFKNVHSALLDSVDELKEYPYDFGTFIDQISGEKIHKFYLAGNWNNGVRLMTWTFYDNSSIVVAKPSVKSTSVNLAVSNEFTSMNVIMNVNKVSEIEATIAASTGKPVLSATSMESHEKIDIDRSTRVAIGISLSIIFVIAIAFIAYHISLGRSKEMTTEELHESLAYGVA